MDYLLYILINIIVAASRLAKPFSRLWPGLYDEWTPGKRRKILLVGYNGARNTGSDVRVIAIARQLKELFGPGEIKITVMTLDPSTMEGYLTRMWRCSNSVLSSHWISSEPVPRIMWPFFVKAQR